tara:strand:+ start:2257 stop:2748 length:492 start_codon:yes stop_codon:yes gene_type:complete
MTKKLEEEFNLPPIDEASEEDVPTVEESKSQIEEYKQALSLSEKINNAFKEVQGLDEHESEMSEIGKEALDSYRQLMDLGMNVSDMAAGKVFAEASNMLKIALEASDAKTKAKLQQIDLMIRKQRADKMGGGPSNDDVQLGQATVFDRNELLKMISENSKNPK